MGVLHYRFHAGELLGTKRVREETPTGFTWRTVPVRLERSVAVEVEIDMAGVRALAMKAAKAKGRRARSGLVNAKARWA